MSVDYDRVAEQAKTGSRAAADAPGGRSALEAGAALLAAFGQLLPALGKLAAAEGRLLRASIPLFFVASIALAVFGVTLWLCLVALIGWLLMDVSGSLLLALGLLVLIHVLLVGGIGLVLLVAWRQASFPRTRTELRLLGRTLRYDLQRATGAVEDPLRPPSAVRKSNQDDTP